MAPYKRTVLLINKKFQLRFSLFVCSWVFGLSLVYPLLIYSLYNFFFRYMAVDPNGPQLAVLEDTRRRMILLLVLLQILFIAITFLMSLFISHRIAGPLHKLGMFFRQARDGKMETLRFRDKDHFKELAEGYNEMISAIQSGQSPKSEASDAAALHIQKALEKLPVGHLDIQHELTQALNTLRPTAP
ncbi:MAG: hypothetical protein H7222_05345 [Methylotenera sp.]|nr:hypothetical protein [Oligoflexia bacterium]